MDKKWKPTIDQVNGPISRTWDFISDEATELMEELQCPQTCKNNCNEHAK